MDNHASTSRIDRSGRLRFVPWRVRDHHTASPFTLAGISLLTSLFDWIETVDRLGLFVGLVGLHVLALVGGRRRHVEP